MTRKKFNTVFSFSSPNMYLFSIPLGQDSSLYLPIVVQSLSYVRLFPTPWTIACQASLSFTIAWSVLKLISIESEMPYKYLILYHPLLLLPSIFPSIRVYAVSWLFASGGQIIGASASASVLPRNIQG